MQLCLKKNIKKKFLQFLAISESVLMVWSFAIIKISITVSQHYLMCRETLETKSHLDHGLIVWHLVNVGTGDKSLNW